MTKLVRYKGKYLVSENGDIFQIYKYKIKKKKLTETNDGYLRTRINERFKLVHRIVMEAFKGESDLTVDHKDRNKKNNNLSNLEYVTFNENIKRACDKRVIYDGEEYESQTKLAEHLKVSKSLITKKIKMNQELFNKKIEVIK